MRVKRLLKQTAIPLLGIASILAPVQRSQAFTPSETVVLKRSTSLPMFAQERITGKVLDDKGETMPGVTIQSKNNPEIKAVTDIDGQFSIAIKTSSDVLIFQFIGFRTKEVPVRAGASALTVSLEADISALDEVVVIGYGTQKKADLSGAIGTVNGERIAERNVVQVSDALQGSVAGLTVTRSNGAPGTGSGIRVRGMTTIGDNEPLILIDGVPASSIDNVHPADIENISVLKDAASASIYGSKAAAGVILVTTKRAKTGQMVMDVTYNGGIVEPTAFPEMANVTRYMRMVNEIQWNDVNNPANGEYPFYTRDVIENYGELNAQNPDVYPNTNWRDLLLKDQSHRQSILFNVAGGTETVKSRVSLGYDNADGLYMGKNYDRIIARINNNIKINNALNASLDLNYKRSSIENPSESPMTNAYRAAPVYAAVWSNGLVAEGKTGNNMYAQLLHGGYNNSWNNQLGGRASLDFTPLNGLKFTAVVAPTLNFNKNKEFRKKVQYTSYDDPTTYVGTTDWGGSTNLNEGRVESYNLTSQFLVNYDKSFRDHNFELLGGYENYYYNYESVGAFSDNMTLDSYPYLNLGNPNFVKSSGTSFENASSSFFSRLNYNFKRKYLLQANFRIDGSSRFHKDYRWGSFPSLSAAWVASEEGFLKNVKALSFLKLRASWGVLGNERIGNYPYQATINFANALIYQGGNIISVPTAAQQAYAIEDISWESTESYNVGLDLGFFNNRLNVSADAYRKTTRDMLLTLEIPGYMGYGNPDQNAGEMYTKGWDLQGSWSDKVRDFRYSVGFNLSDAKSNITDLAGIQFLGDQIKVAGSEFNEWFGYRSLGLFQNAQDVATSPVLNAGLAPGDVKYADLSGPDGVPDGKISEYDKVPLGGSLPRYMFGGNLELGYKNFDFGLTFQGVAKQNSQLTSNMIQPYLGSWGNMPMEIEGKYWSAYNTPEQNSQARYPRLTNKFTSNNYAMSDFWLINGAYFRLKNISLGYTIPTEVAGKVYLKGARVFATVSDGLSFNHFPKGWDPEVSNTGHPITRTFNFGVSARF